MIRKCRSLVPLIVGIAVSLVFFLVGLGGLAPGHDPVFFNGNTLGP